MRKEIDDIYKKEFELKEAEKDAIGIITANLDKTKKREAVYDKEKELYTYKAPKAEIIKDENKITAANIGADYYQYIDPKILKKGIELYNNKHPNEKLTESDFIITKNKKEEPNISGITSKSAQFTEFMNLLIDDKGTWDVIAEANEKIATLGTKTLKDGTTQVYSEFFEKTEDIF